MDELGGHPDGTESQSTKRPGWPVDLYRVRKALLNGKLWLVGSAVFGLSFGLFWVKIMMGRSYEATAVLKYEGDVQIAGLQRPVGYALGPAAEALERESFLRKVRDESGMEISLLSIARSIDYKPDFRAGTLHVRVGSDTAESAAELTHLVTKVFLDYHSERQARRIEQEIERIAERIEGAEQEAEEARRRYNEFRERHGIADLSTEQQSVVQSAAQLRASSDLARSEIRAREAQVKSLETQLASIPKTSVVSGGPGPERAAYNRLRQELASARASLSPDHPRVQALEQQVTELRSQLRGGGSSDGLVGSNTTYTAVDTQLRNAKAELTILRERQKGLAEMAEKAQRRLDAFSGVEGEASALLAEVEVNEALIGNLRRTEAALEDALEHPPSGFAVLEPGSVPEFPVRNPMKPVIFAAIAGLSVLVALVFILWREFRGLRMQTSAEIAFWGNGPVLGATPWPRDPRGLDELVAGLDDFAPNTKGMLLIVGGAPGDRPLARELARRMSDDWFPNRPAPEPQVVRSVVPPAPAPIQTPPPSGPYPVSGARPQSAAPSQKPSTSLALRPVQLVRRQQDLELEAWDGPFEGQALRRAARLADRVVVLVRSGAMSALAIQQIPRRIGRAQGIGYLVVALPDELQTLPDRCGKVAEFWGDESGRKRP